MSPPSSHVSCSALARSSLEPLAGSAPHTRAWVALEQPGPWGPRALTDSHLPARLGDRLTAAAESAGVTVVLVRRPGPHPDRHVEQPRALVVAGLGPDGRPWLETTRLARVDGVLDLDLAAIAAGRRPGLVADDERILLVCTNARRDQCCALLGRPVVERLAARWPGRVWESSHLGGHRFAPTVLSLPDGYVYGGPDAATLGLGACRGRSWLERSAQAAELAVLSAAGDTRPRPLEATTLEGTTNGGKRLRVVDGASTWSVEVVERALPPRPESCGQPPVPGVSYAAAVRPRLGSV